METLTARGAWRKGYRAARERGDWDFAGAWHGGVLGLRFVTAARIAMSPALVPTGWAHLRRCLDEHLGRSCRARAAEAIGGHDDHWHRAFLACLCPDCRRNRAHLNCP